MAILKHIASKNADYGEAQRYLMFQYNEDTMKPILDEDGRLIPRDEYYLDGINCDPFSFDMECKELNAQYNKNHSFDEIKSHHYILSFDPRDMTENGLTGERAQQLGLEYARNNFPGHQALVCTHTDGHNESGNIHVHIVINSLRKYDVDRQDFMERPCDSCAGYKHHLTKDYLSYLKQDVMNLCLREHLHQVDLLSPAEKKVNDREYHARRRGQKKMDKLNQKMLADGILPRKTKFETQKDFLRSAIEETAASSHSLEEFQKLLKEKYLISFKTSRGRFSYLHPERGKYITGRSLGSHYEKEYLLSQWEKKAMQKQALFSEQKSSEDTSWNSMQNNLPAFVFIKSNLKLVVDLQNCVKAQQSSAYARKVKLSNLQQMAKTVAYIQEHGYDTEEDLEKASEEAETQTANMRKALRSTEDKLRQVNEQIHYTGQYLANKSIYRQFINSTNKTKFRQEHQTEITLYETARKILKGYSADGKLPSMKLLKVEKGNLTALKNSQYEAYQNLRKYEKELHTVQTNIDTFLGKDRSQQSELEKETTRS
ncbi:MAG TPA: relaxase/mobilization nuclease domain-containing protein [Candidatus Anaerostipes avistercoris]|uniref:Relaxase/mobilization nuclease domain-containing protein n=1 Tax=Candidatus Anaerostipes avistercoris TaxID=2838462 RepID=A0A9D2PGT2_9FIRM|nr:relaxase/mobilization nuclease domain-containing protein [Candidatus Anaerostipes avistercoris]